MKQRNSDTNSYTTQKQHPVMFPSIKHILLLLCLCMSSTWIVAQNAPVAIGDINNTFVNTSISGNVLTNDFDLDGDNLIVNMNPVTLPHNGTFVMNVDGSYVYTPNIGYVGTEQFQYVICDDGTPSMCDTAWCTIQVFEKLNGQNNAPIANYDYIHTKLNSVTIGNLLNNDFDLDGDGLAINSTPVVSPANGTITINPNGSFAYVSNFGFRGLDAIVYEICDNNGLCSQGNLVIRVLDTLTTATNQKPTAVDDVFLTSINTMINGNVFQNDHDVNGNNITSQIVQLPINGTLLLNTDGTFAYLPDPGFVGTDQCIYQVCDDGNPVLCDTATVYIVISNNPINSVTSTNSLTCSSNDGTITINTFSSSSFEYSIDGGFSWSSNPLFSDLFSGTYFIKTRNLLTLDEYDYPNNPVIINTPNAPQIDSIVTTNPSSCTIKDGSLQIYASGSSTGYHYSLSGIDGVYQYSNDYYHLGGNVFNIAVSDGNKVCTTTYAMPIEITPLDNGYVVTTNVRDVSDCNQTDGRIEINTSNLHTGVVEYTIDNGLNWQTSPIFSNLSSGHYKFKARHDESNCVYSEDLSIKSATQPIITTIDKTFTSGCNIADGSLTIHASADSILLYSIDNGTTWQTDSIFNGLHHGNYYIAVKKIDDSCITYWQEDGYYEYGYYLPHHGPDATLTQTGDDCGTNDGYIHVINNYYHGYPNYVHSIDGGTTWQSSREFNNLSSGTYYLSIKHALDTCISVFNRPLVIVDRISPSISNISKVDATNCGTNDGSITISVVGTAKPYFSIDGGLHWQTDSVFTNLALGNYSILVRDSSANCTDTASTWITISAPNAPTIVDVSSTSPTDCNNNDGTITITATGGTAPLEYSINDGTTWVTNGGTFTGLSGGTYCIKVKNADGTCETTHFECVQLENKLSTTIYSITKEAPTNCVGNSGFISMNYAYLTPYPLEFSIDSGLTWQSSSYFNNLSCGSYYGMMRYQDGSCETAVGLIDLTLVNEAPVFYKKTIYTIPQAIISADLTGSSYDPNGDAIVYDTVLVKVPNNGSLTFNSNGSFTYQSDSGFIGIDTIEYTGCDIPTNSSLPSLCETGLVVIRVNPNLSPVAGDDYISTCSSIDINALVNDYDSNYTTPISITNILQNPTGGTAQIVNNSTGGYINYTPTSIANIPNARDTILYEICDEGTPSLCDTGFIFITIDNIANPIDSITYTDINCDEYGTITFHKNTYGIYEYSIDDGISYQYSYKEFENLPQGTYQPSYRNFQNNQYCRVDLPAITIKNTTASIDTITTVLPTQCGSADGSLTVFPDSVHYEYSIDGFNWQSSNHFTNLLTGTYDVKVRDTTTNCSNPVYSYLTSLIIAGDSIPSITNVQVSDITDCGLSDGTITIFSIYTGSPVEYSIDSGQTWSSSASFTGLAQGLYYPMTRKATDISCISTHSPVNVKGKILPVITNVTITNPSNCGVNDGSIVVTATGQSLEYSIDGGLNWQSSPIFTGLLNGTYNIAVRNTDGTCLIFDANNPAIITTVDAPTITNVTSTNPINCGLNNGSITITTTGGSGAYEYSIDGVNWQVSNSFTGLSGGLYYSCVRNSNGTCTTCNFPINLIAPNSPIINNVVATNPTDCNVSDGTITINSTGILIEYSIDGGTTWQSSNTFIGLPTGSYQIKIRNWDGTCEVDYIGNMVTLNAPTMPTITNISQSNPTTCNSNDGTITITAAGGIGSYDYSIDGGLTWTNTTGIFTGLDCGTYNIAIRNSDGTCLNFSNNITLSTITPIAVDDTVSTNINTPVNGNVLTNDSSPSGNPLTVSTTPHTPASNGSLVISSNGDFTYTPIVGFTGLDSFLYQVCVFDGTFYHCDTAVVILSVVAPPNQAPIAVNDHFYPLGTSQPWNVLTNDTDPDGDNLIVNTTLVSLPNHGTITVSAAGVINYTQTSWFSGIDSFQYEVCDDGVSSLCDTATAYIGNAIPNVYIVTIDSTNASCNTANGAITITAAGGSGNYQYSIDNGQTWQTNNIFTGLGAGLYNVKVHDGFDTTSTISTIITILSSPIVVSATYNADQLTINATGQNVLEYTIDSGQTWQSSNIFYPVSLDSIDIGVRYINGLCEEYSSLTITNNPPITVVDSVQMPQTGYQSINVLLNDYDLENNALFTKPQINYYGLDSLTLDSTGLLSIPTNALTLGSYMINYETCELYNPTNCTQGAAYFQIVAPSDTLQDTIVQGTTTQICVPFADLPGTFDTMIVILSPMGTITIDSINNNCLFLYGDMNGNDTIVVVIYDNFGFFDTTLVAIHVETGVWPGDTDDDASVDNLDLLNIGLGYGQIGTMRNNVTNVWNGYRSALWNVATPLTNVDYRHADANGDGMVNSDDTLAIIQNWQKFYVKNISSSVQGAVPIYIDTTGAFSNLPNLSLDIMLGTPNNPVTSLYGGAFSYEYDTTIYETHNASITIDTSWVGIKNLDLLSLSVSTPNAGRIDAAMTRIDGMNVNGIGAIAKLNLTIRDDILQRPVLNMDSLIFSFVLSNVKFISNNETDIPVDVLTTGFTFYTSTENVGIGQYINVFPNPSRDRIMIQTERLQIESYEILDMTGRLIFNKEVTPQNVHQVNLDAIPSGIYNLRMQTNEGIANKRIVIVR